MIIIQSGKRRTERKAKGKRQKVKGKRQKEQSPTSEFLKNSEV
jgi:hypothetical protein